MTRLAPLPVRIPGASFEPTPMHDALVAKHWPAPKTTTRRRDSKGRFTKKEQAR